MVTDHSAEIFCSISYLRLLLEWEKKKCLQMISSNAFFMFLSSARSLIFKLSLSFPHCFPKHFSSKATRHFCYKFSLSHCRNIFWTNWSLTVNIIWTSRLNFIVFLLPFWLFRCCFSLALFLSLSLPNRCQYSIWQNLIRLWQ